MPHLTPTNLKGIMSDNSQQSIVAGPAESDAGQPTIVLVHGAWAESSSWAPVLRRLQTAGYPVVAIANPLQGVVNDTAYLSSRLAAIDGPMVLVGHSYGGALITNVETSAFDVVALVYVAAFIPVAGETVGELAARSTPPLPLVTVDVPGGAEVLIDPAAFRDAFAGDLDEGAAGELAIVQRPANVNAVTEAVVSESHRTVPSWALVTLQDHAISPELQQLMVGRTSVRVTEVESSHAVMISHPDVVADVIMRAARGGRDHD